MSDRVLILAIGDVHLGAACSGLPGEINSWGVDPAELTPATALRRAVDFAIENGVDAVLFAGDVVDGDNARFEAMAPLEESVRRLLGKGIGVIGVAGNHDFEALPRLAALMDGFTLLGKGGKWESVTVAKAGIPRAQVVGWSFGDQHVRQSPVAMLLNQTLQAPSPPFPRIGLLHGDLDASGGPYAPIRQTELNDTGYDAWLLGHIHKPSLEGLSGSGGSRPCGYLGSLVGLDPSETGPHGPWLLKGSDDGGISLEQVTLAPLRWDGMDLEITGIEHVEDVPDRLLDAAQQHFRQLEQTGQPLPRALGLRVRLIGTSASYEAFRQWIADGQWRLMYRVVAGTVIFFNRIIDAMELHLDLEHIALGDDPAALLARRLLSLGRDDDQARELLGRARGWLGEITEQAVWSPLREQHNAPDPLSDKALRDVLLRSGKAALSNMLSGMEAGDRP